MQKVLIVTYYWPPAGGPGVQRWLKFVKYLQDFDVKPVVYIPENPNYPIIDTSLVDEIPSDIKIVSHKISEPYTLAKLFAKNKTKQISSGVIQEKNQSFVEKMMLWVRGNFYIPDARKNWVKPSVLFLSKVIKEENIKTVITTGPPHSVHLIGHQLKEKFKIKWVADFRDPWTSIGYHKKLRLSKTSEQKHKDMESLVLNSANSILVTSNITKKEFQQITKKPIEVITNGFDGELSKGRILDDKFTISHIGSLLSGRNPKNLWEVLSELSNENDDFKERLQIQLIGVVSEDVLQTLQKFHLIDKTNLVGYVWHSDVKKYQEQSQVLLLIEIDTPETEGIIAGKLFEYLQAKRPILGIGPKNWEVASIIAETKSGVAFDHATKSELKSLLLSWFQLYMNGKLKSESVEIEKYSRKELTAKLAQHLYGYCT